MKYFSFALIVFFLFMSEAYALPDDCQEQVAPSNFEYRSTGEKGSYFPTNGGIVPRGFVALEDKQKYPVVHGIDVSKWQQSVDFERARDCGAQFSYIRLSAGTIKDNELEFLSHWRNARHFNLLVGPYHNLTVVDPKRPYSKLSLTEKDSIIKESINRANKQADIFAGRLYEVLSDDLKPDDPRLLGRPYLPVALDTSIRPQSKFSVEDRRAFGEVYRAAICTWIRRFQQIPAFSNQPVMLYTFATTYNDYELQKSDCGLDKASAWITHYNVDGGHVLLEKNPVLLAQIEQMCATGEEFRCKFHQYTSFGGFAVFRKDEGLDMDRFYGTREQLDRLLQQANNIKP